MRGLGIAGAFLAAVVMLVSCRDGGQSDQEAVDEVIATFEARMRDGGLEPASDDEDDDADDEDGGLELESEECQDLDRLFGDDELPGETASAEIEMELDSGDRSVISMTGLLGMTDDSDALGEYFDLLGDARVPGCFQEALDTELSAAAEASGAELAPFTAEPLQSEIGERNVGFRFTGSVTAQGMVIPLTMDMEFARVGRAGAGIMIFTSGAAEPPLSRSEALELLVDGIEDRATG